MSICICPHPFLYNQKSRKWYFCQKVWRIRPKTWHVHTNWLFKKHRVGLIWPHHSFYCVRLRMPNMLFLKKHFDLIIFSLRFKFQTYIINTDIVVTTAHEYPPVMQISCLRVDFLLEHKRVQFFPYCQLIIYK